MGWLRKPAIGKVGLVEHITDDSIQPKPSKEETKKAISSQSRLIQGGGRMFLEKLGLSSTLLVIRSILVTNSEDMHAANQSKGFPPPRHRAMAYIAARRTNTEACHRPFPIVSRPKSGDLLRQCCPRHWESLVTTLPVRGSFSS